MRKRWHTVFSELSEAGISINNSNLLRGDEVALGRTNRNKKARNVSYFVSAWSPVSPIGTKLSSFCTFVNAFLDFRIY